MPSSEADTPPPGVRLGGSVAQQSSPFYSDAELQAQGVFFHPAPKPSSSRDFMCGDKDKRVGCICREPHPCVATGNCITLKENIAASRTALAAKGDRRVTCKRAELGTCGDFSYFYFEGDIHRFEMRWFGQDGEFVAMRRTTDYTEYCDGTALVSWNGAVPNCAAMVRTELICGEGDRPLLTPLADIVSFTRKD